MFPFQNYGVVFGQWWDIAAELMHKLFKIVSEPPAVTQMLIGRLKQAGWVRVRTLEWKSGSVCFRPSSGTEGGVNGTHWRWGSNSLMVVDGQALYFWYMDHRVYSVGERAFVQIHSDLLSCLKEDSVLLAVCLCFLVSFDASWSI